LFYLCVSYIFLFNFFSLVASVGIVSAIIYDSL
jgi:hypothetical protein